MNNYLMISLFSSAIGYVFSELFISVWLKLTGLFPIKPFSCGYCLSFWVGAVFTLCIEPNLFYAIGCGCLASVINMGIFKYLR